MLANAARMPTKKATNTPEIGNLINVAAKVPPQTMRNPGRLRKIDSSDSVMMASITTVTPITNPRRVAMSTCGLPGKTLGQAWNRLRRRP